ncbi:hypothetical protein MPSEU_000687500 [Mayamaea pseudoterrestris]|nr:hypothetical protein MPSEU_000687500 [Mayamaea pseudoterrestris]
MMLRTTAATLLLLALLCVMHSAQARGRVFSDRLPVAFLPQTQRVSQLSACILRGGAQDSDDEEEDSDEDTSEDESDEEEEEEIAETVAPPPKTTTPKKKPTEIDAKLAAKRSAQLAASTLQKQASAKAKASKQAVNAKLATKKKRRRLSLKVPYILRACLNPITVFKMTIAYWKSLVQLDYGKQDSSQELRSALQTKARTQGGSKRPPRRRNNRPTTINDLPRLNT